eukprot:TRINITY_DN138_c1_g1_i2.p1 TRINITY_DN138_c1_g1~~TRINITY_DN138_c1_g1_i2.p1  ORF type:complete len:377 (-),score=110.38 TRINITY_DN138_c1_g1_i2:330-1460(-)
MIKQNFVKGTNIFFYETNTSTSSSASSPMLTQACTDSSSDSDLSSPRFSQDESDFCHNSSSNCERDISASFRSSLFVGGEDEENYHQQESYGQSREETMRPPDYLPLDYFHNQLLQGGGSYVQQSMITVKQTSSTTKGFGLTKSEQEFKDLIQRFPVSKSMEDLVAKSAGIDLFSTTPEYSSFDNQQKTQEVKREISDLCVVSSPSDSSAFYQDPSPYHNQHQNNQQSRHQPPPPPLPSLHGLDVGLMEKFSDVRTTDFKHVIYNLLVDNYNNSIGGNSDPNFISIVEPATIQDGGVTRYGFTFRDEAQPERILPELYSTHIRNTPLEDQNPSSIFIFTSTTFDLVWNYHRNTLRRREGTPFFMKMFLSLFLEVLF